MSKPLQVAILPAGQWGTALAVPAAQRGCAVRLWLRNPADRSSFAAGRQVRRLPGVQLPPGIIAVADTGAALRGADLVVLAAPSRHLRQLCHELRSQVPGGARVVSVTKGLEPDTHLRMSQVITSELDIAGDRVAVLSGPNFAREVALNLPAGTVVASTDPHTAELVQDAFMSQRLRVYTNRDVVGVELAGALKNVMAIAAGVVEGLGLGLNARATVITRGLKEIARLGTALGADAETFSGLAGLGDLVLTCTGDLSRNRQLGLAIGGGADPQQYLAERPQTVEGVPTAQAALELAATVGVELPITYQVQRILFAGARPLECLEALMRREKTGETG